MTNIFSGNTFSAYAGFLDPAANEWVGMSFAAGKELLAQLSAQFDMSQTAFGLYLDFLSLIEFQDDAAIFKVMFDEHSCPVATAYPIIRKSKENGAYVIQIDAAAIDLLSVRSIVKLQPQLLEVGESSDKYYQPCFTVTLPTQQSANDLYGAVARVFSLKVDAIRVGEDSKLKELAAEFGRNPGSPETLALVANFKEGTYNKQLKELAVGDYKILSFDFAQREKKEDNSKWTVTQLTLENGEVFEASANTRIIKPLSDFATAMPYRSAITSKGCFWLRITGHEITVDKNGVEKVSIEGGLFKDVPPPVVEKTALRAPKQKKQFKQDNFLPSLPSGGEATTIDVSAQSVAKQAVEQAGSTPAANPVVMPKF